MNHRDVNVVLLENGENTATGVQLGNRRRGLDDEHDTVEALQRRNLVREQGVRSGEWVAVVRMAGAGPGRMWSFHWPFCFAPRLPS